MYIVVYISSVYHLHVFHITLYNVHSVVCISIYIYRVHVSIFDTIEDQFVRLQSVTNHALLDLSDVRKNCFQRVLAQLGR